MQSIEDKFARIEARLGVIEAKLGIVPEKEFVPGPPHGPIDYTERMTMSRSAIEEMARAVPTGMVREIVREQKKRP